MAKGQLAKESIKNKILEVFDGAFTYSNGKELRIPFDENGVPVQIKVALTCAKDNVNPTGEVLEKSAAVPQENGEFMNFPEPRKKAEITEEEKKNVEDLMKALGLD